jgi:hypothetical protein
MAGKTEAAIVSPEAASDFELEKDVGPNAATALDPASVSAVEKEEGTFGAGRVSGGLLQGESLMIAAQEQMKGIAAFIDSHSNIIPALVVLLAFAILIIVVLLKPPKAPSADPPPEIKLNLHDDQ